MQPLEEGGLFKIEHIPAKLNPRHCIDWHSFVSHALPMSTLLRDNCWICREPLGAEATRTDEFGFIAHEKCLRDLKERKDSVVKMPDTPKP
jgi:hypothetical protein